MTEHASPDKPARTRRLVVGASAVVVVVVGLLLGTILVRPAAIATLGGELHEVQTTSATYLGRLAGDDGAYTRLQAPAVVTVETSQDGGDSQVVVRSLNAEPYGLAGEILIARAQIVLVSSVASDSQLARAYRDALGN